MSGNNASNNEYGIWLESSSNNMLSGNKVSNNGNVDGAGILMESSSNNTIYNNIFSNTNNVYFSESNIDAWNTTKQLGTNIIGSSYIGGNFWANPGGTGFSQFCSDGDKNGVCDSNYTLASGNVDYLPLTIPAGYDYISGTVRNNSIGISGVVVTTNTSNSTTTDTSGIYSLLVPDGIYNLTATNEPTFYPNSSITVTLVAGTTVAQDIELLKKPTGNISGFVMNIWN